MAIVTCIEAIDPIKGVVTNFALESVPWVWEPALAPGGSRAGALAGIDRRVDVAKGWRDGINVLTPIINSKGPLRRGIVYVVVRRNIYISVGSRCLRIVHGLLSIQ